MRVHTSYNSSTAIEKIKIVVEPAIIDVPMHQRAVLFKLLDVVIEKVETCVTTDRGHVHSSGQTTSEFYFKHPAIAEGFPHANESSHIVGSPRNDGGDKPGHDDGPHRDTHDAPNQGQRSSRNDPPSRADNTFSKKPRVHDNAPPVDAGQLDEGAVNTSCSTIEYYEINSTGSPSDDDGSVASYEVFSASVDVPCQTHDTIPPEASTTLLTSPSHLLDAAMGGYAQQISNAFSSLRASLVSADEIQLASRGPAVLSLDLPIDVGSDWVDLNAFSELSTIVRLKLMEFQYAYAEALEYLDVGWAASDAVNGVVINTPRNDDHEECMRITNVYMYLSLCKTIEMYSPFCASSAEITQHEAADAVTDYLYASRYSGQELNETVHNVRAKFSNGTELPFLDFVALQAGDYDACAPFWNKDIHCILLNSH